MPAGASETVEWTVELDSPGPFEAQLDVYLDDHGLRDLPLVVRGTVVPATQERPPEGPTSLGEPPTGKKAP